MLFNEELFLKQVEKTIKENPINEEMLLEIIKLAGEFSKYGFKLNKFLSSYLEDLKSNNGYYYNKIKDMLLEIMRNKNNSV